MKYISTKNNRMYQYDVSFNSAFSSGSNGGIVSLLQWLFWHIQVCNMLDCTILQYCTLYCLSVLEWPTTNSHHRHLLLKSLSYHRKNNTRRSLCQIHSVWKTMRMLSVRGLWPLTAVFTENSPAHTDQQSYPPPSACTLPPAQTVPQQ